MMKTRLAPILIVVVALMPATVSAQADDAVAFDGVDTALIAQLCAATAADEAEQGACISAEEHDPLDGARSLLDETEARIDETLSRVRQLDFQATLDEVLRNVQDLELGVAVDLQAAIDDAGIQEALDDTLMTLQQPVDDARAVVAEAQLWAQQNTDAVCRGGSVSLGTTVGLAVFALTGVEWLGLQAFWATERFSNGLCGDFAE